MKFRRDHGCNYEHKTKSGVLVIHDLDLGGASVTNNIADVLEEIRDSGISFDDIPIVYKDSDGFIDGIELQNGSLGSVHFISLKTKDEDEAIQRMKDRGLLLWR